MLQENKKCEICGSDQTEPARCCSNKRFCRNCGSVYDEDEKE